MADHHLLTPAMAPGRLDFGDKDLTDTFADVEDSFSSSGAGHPRGSSPLSGLSSRHSTPSSAAMLSPARGSGALAGYSAREPGVLPNMSALLEFLDGDTPVKRRDPAKEGRPAVAKDGGAASNAAMLLRALQTEEQPPTRSGEPLSSTLSKVRQTTGSPLTPTPGLASSSFPSPSGRQQALGASVLRRSQELLDARPRATVHLSATPASSSHLKDEIQDRAAQPGGSAFLDDSNLRSHPQPEPLGPPARARATAADRMAAALMEGAPPPSRWAPPVPPATAPPILRYHRPETYGLGGPLKMPFQSDYAGPSGFGREAHGRTLLPLTRSGNSDLPQSLIEEVQRELASITSRTPEKGASHCSTSASGDELHHLRQQADQTDLSTAEGHARSAQPGQAGEQSQSDPREEEGDTTQRDARQMHMPPFASPHNSSGTIFAEDRAHLTRTLAAAEAEVTSLRSTVESLKHLVDHLAVTNAPADPRSILNQLDHTLPDDDAAGGALVRMLEFVRFCDGLVWHGHPARRDSAVFHPANIAKLKERIHLWAVLARKTESLKRIVVEA